MKNKFLFNALLACVLAFALYTVSSNHLKQAKIRVIGAKNEQIINSSTVRHRKKAAKRAAKPTNLKITQGSIPTVTRKVSVLMKGNKNYQVAVQNVRYPYHFTRLSDDQKLYRIKGVLRLFLLAALYQEEAEGKLTAHTTIKMRPTDKVKGDKLLRKNIAYGVANLRQAMLEGDQAAANALLHKIGQREVNKVASRLGANHTRVDHDFSAKFAGTTTATDLVTAMTNLARGRGLNAEVDETILMALQHQHCLLSQRVLAKDRQAGLADSNAAVALVKKKGHLSCMAVCSTSSNKFARLGQIIYENFK